jgi:hypothetical protein
VGGDCLILELFTESFINRMFDLVEFTRTEEDEAFNYSLIKLIVRNVYARRFAGSDD